MANKNTVLQVRVDDDMLSGLDELRRIDHALPGRSEMMRKILARAIVDGLPKSKVKASVRDAASKEE